MTLTPFLGLKFCLESCGLQKCICELLQYIVKLINVEMVGPFCLENFNEGKLDVYIFLEVMNLLKTASILYSKAVGALCDIENPLIYHHSQKVNRQKYRVS